MTFNQDESTILTCWYLAECNTHETLDELINILQKHGDTWKGKYYIYRKICKETGFALSSGKPFEH